MRYLTPRVSIVPEMTKIIDKHIILGFVISAELIDVLLGSIAQGEICLYIFISKNRQGEILFECTI